jgi:hypothetical protein
MRSAPRGWPRSAVGRLAARCLPILGVLLPGSLAVAVQEDIRLSEVLHHFPPGVSYGALPRAMLAAVAMACVVGNGTGFLGRVAAAFAVPAVGLVFIAPPGLGGGVPQLAAVGIAFLSGLAASTAAQHRRVAPFGGWCLVLAVASAMVVLSGFAKLGIVLAALAVATGLWTCSAMAGWPSMGSGMSTALATALAACAFLGCGYDESGFPRWTWALLAASPAAAALFGTPADARGGETRARARLRTAATVLAPAAVAVIALASALVASGAFSSTSVPATGADTELSGP